MYSVGGIVLGCGESKGIKSKFVLYFRWPEVNKWQKGEGEVASKLPFQQGVDWPQAELLLDQYQDQLQLKEVKHHKAKHQQGKRSASIQAPCHQCYALPGRMLHAR